MLHRHIYLNKTVGSMFAIHCRERKVLLDLFSLFLGFGAFPVIAGIVGNVVVNTDLVSSQVLRLGIELRVDSFNPLSSVESKAHMPLSKKWTNMIFQHMQFGSNCHVREFVYL